MKIKIFVELKVKRNWRALDFAEMNVTLHTYFLVSTIRWKWWGTRLKNRVEFSLSLSLSLTRKSNSPLLGQVVSSPKKHSTNFAKTLRWKRRVEQLLRHIMHISPRQGSAVRRAMDSAIKKHTLRGWLNKAKHQKTFQFFFLNLLIWKIRKHFFAGYYATNEEFKFFVFCCEKAL